MTMPFGCLNCPKKSGIEISRRLPIGSIRDDFGHLASKASFRSELGVRWIVRASARIAQVAIAGQCLLVTIRALFHIASWSMQLSFDSGAIMTGVGVRMPVEGFVSIFDSWQQSVADRIMCPFLCGG
jgi:hypothetical protein